MEPPQQRLRAQQRTELDCRAPAGLAMTGFFAADPMTVSSPPRSRAKSPSSSSGTRVARRWRHWSKNGWPMHTPCGVLREGKRECVWQEAEQWNFPAVTFPCICTGARDENAQDMSASSALGKLLFSLVDGLADGRIGLGEKPLGFPIALFRGLPCLGRGF